jgi:hypothetical protein
MLAGEGEGGGISPTVLRASGEFLGSVTRMTLVDD